MDPIKPTRFTRRAERVHREVSILHLLNRLGFAVHPDENRDQQFKCPLHGDGQDSKPSAKAYPSTNLWHCFGCPRTRNTISTVESAMRLDRIAAVKWLEESYGLPPLPFEVEEPVAEAMPFLPAREPPSPERLRARAEAFLRGLARERAASFEALAARFEQLDQTPEDPYELELFVMGTVHCSW